MSVVLSQFFAALRFYSRYPFKAHAEVRFDAMCVRVVPLVGVAVVILPALLLTLALRWFSPFVAASIAVAALVVVTGALHEDGLADCADAQGASSPTRRLDIMRDSRIGSFGALALGLALLLRIAALAAIASISKTEAMLVLIATAAISRTVGLLPAIVGPAARADGAGAAFGTPAVTDIGVAFALAALLGFLPMAADASFSRCLIAMLVSFAVARAVAAAARRQIGGFTGDVLGAAQQLAEIVMYLCFAAT